VLLPARIWARRRLDSRKQKASALKRAGAEANDHASSRSSAFSPRQAHPG
jgi:hypothetical protein